MNLIKPFENMNRCSEVLEHIEGITMMPLCCIFSLCHKFKQESQMFQPAEALALASRKPSVREEVAGKIPLCEYQRMNQKFQKSVAEQHRATVAVKWFGWVRFSTRAMQVRAVCEKNSDSVQGQLLELSHVPDLQQEHLLQWWVEL